MLDKMEITNGWKQLNAGSTQQIDYNYRYDLYVRRRPLNSIINTSREKDDSGLISKNNPESLPENAEKTSLPGRTQKGLWETHSDNWVQTEADNDRYPVLSDFPRFPSLLAIRRETPSIVIGFDSEWYGNPRTMLSWQFAVIFNGQLIEFIFFKKLEKYDLTLEIALARVLDYILPDTSIDVRSITKYQCLGEIDPLTGLPTVLEYDTKSEASKSAQHAYVNGQITTIRISDILSNQAPLSDGDKWKSVKIIRDYSQTPHIPITLVSHSGIGDLSSLDQNGAYNRDFLCYLTEAQGGLFTLQPFSLHPTSVLPGAYRRIYPVTLSIRDTMCHAPGKSKSLKDLGAVVNIPKIELPENTICHMDRLLIEDRSLYMEYASNDAVIVLLYMSALYGYNRDIPVTITSATASVMKQIMMKYLECSTTSEFNTIYRGIGRVKHGKVPRENKPGYLDSTSLEPISDKANTIQYYASQAYHGGYNSCSDVGYFDAKTYDYDLQNAYPTAMCLVPDVDWDNCYLEVITNRELTLHDFMVMDTYTPFPMMLCYCRFEFPADVPYPCIPVTVDGIPIYPHTSEGLNGVYACGPELYLAVRLGAKVWVETGYRITSRITADGESYSLRAAVYQLVKDRNAAKASCGKGSLEELILKTMVNSGYGKNAQNVIQKQHWSAYKNMMDDIGGSPITNPVSACMITSIVRACLLAVQNQAAAMGYMTCSVTTDGLISDMPIETLKSLDLYGIRRLLGQARLYLTDGKNSEIWEVKHAQNDLLNFATRGNVSLIVGDPDQNILPGVCAHNSARSGYVSDSYADRLWLAQQVLSRTGRITSVNNEWTGLKDLVNKVPFCTRSVERHLRMDYDFKRKPDRNSFRTVHPVINGTAYEIANFSTSPYHDIAEFRLYRKKAESCECLRTEKDWESFFTKTDLGSGNQKIRDIDWAKLNSCVMGYRSGLWDIPMLSNPKLSVQDKCDWLQSHNPSSTHLFKTSDWKHAREPRRIANMLPREIFEDLLTELQSDVPSS